MACGPIDGLRKISKKVLPAVMAGSDFFVGREKNNDGDKESGSQRKSCQKRKDEKKASKICALISLCAAGLRLSDYQQLSADGRPSAGV